MRILLVLLCLSPLGIQAQNSVITSIEPIYQLTKTIMHGAGEPDLLIKRQSSAHHFSLKPSHFRLLNDADLVIWIDRHFESGFQHLPEILSKNTLSLELLPALGLPTQDGHVWYSAVLLKRITLEIRDALTSIDPEHSDIYEHNSRVLISALDAWLKKSRVEIKTANPLYLLDHEFLRYFEADMGIEPIAVLHNSHGRPNGIKALQIIERKLSGRPNLCLLTNQAIASKLAQNLALKHGLRIYTIGQRILSSEKTPSILEVLNQLSEVLKSCAA